MSKFITVLLVSILIISCGDIETKSLDLNVSKSNTQLIIKNNSNIIYKNCVIKINDDYKLDINEIRPTKTINISLIEFTKKDGTRFNIFTTKVKNIMIYGYVNKNDLGFYNASFR